MTYVFHFQAAPGRLFDLALGLSALEARRPLLHLTERRWKLPLGEVSVVVPKGSDESFVWFGVPPPAPPMLLNQAMAELEPIARKLGGLLQVGEFRIELLLEKRRAEGFYLWARTTLFSKSFVSSLATVATRWARPVWWDSRWSHSPPFGFRSAGGSGSPRVRALSLVWRGTAFRVALDETPQLPSVSLRFKVGGHRVRVSRMADKLAEWIVRYQGGPEAFAQRLEVPVLIFELPEHDPLKTASTSQLHTIPKSGHQSPRFGPEAYVAHVVNPDAKGRITVGRTAGNGVVIDHPSLSRLHAWFEKGRWGWQLVDAGSRNGTVLDAKRLSARDPQRLGDQAVIGFGDVSARYLIPEAFLSFLRSIVA